MMKQITFVALFIALACPVRADILMIMLHRDGTNVVQTLLGKRVSQKDIQKKMSELASHSPDFTVHIRTTPDAKVSDLINLASLLKEAGLKNIVVWSQGKKEEEYGTFLFPMKMMTNSVQLCVTEEKRDFIPTDETGELEEIEKDIEPKHAR
jgi:hypothetical protein